MGKKDPRVDAVIAKSSDFARPILVHIRKVVHETCPDVEETLKWQHPTFMYKGILCGMGSFKEHCTFGFWKASLITAANRFGRDRVTSLADLPPTAELKGLIRKAMALNDQGVQIERTRSAPKKPLPVPTYLKAALKKNARAHAHFAAFSPSKKRDYIEWLLEAKSDATREGRLATAVGWISQGKSRNWKYEKC
jgi:uncharacterized protein YdeI (YjbR/CyaY-like superfamily)